MNVHKIFQGQFTTEGYSFPKNLHAAIREEAHRTRKNRSELIREILRDYFEQKYGVSDVA